MDCIFCNQKHPESYICEARCEARLSAILRLPINYGPRQLTIQESLERGRHRRGKKRPAQPPPPVPRSGFLNTREQSNILLN